MVIKKIDNIKSAVDYGNHVISLNPQISRRGTLGIIAAGLGYLIGCGGGGGGSGSAGGGGTTPEPPASTLTLSEREAVIEDLINREYTGYSILKNQDYAIVNKPSKLHDNFMSFEDTNNKLSGIASVVLYSDTDNARNITIMRGYNETLLIRLYNSEQDKLPDGSGSILSKYEGSPLKALNSIRQTNADKKETLESTVRDILLKENNPRIVPPDNFQPITSLADCGNEEMTVKALGINKDYNIEVYINGALNLTGKNIMSITFGSQNLIVGDNEIMIKAKDALNPQLESKLYKTIDYNGCSGGGGDGGGGGGDPSGPSPW